MSLQKRIAWTLVASALGLGTLGAAHAWVVDTCDGKVVGMRTARTFTLDRCNIPAGSQRDVDVLYAFDEWNSIAGVAHRFDSSAGDADCLMETDDAVAFVTRDSIDGLNGFTSWTDRRCAVLANNDGRRIDIRIH